MLKVKVSVNKEGNGEIFLNDPTFEIGFEVNAKELSHLIDSLTHLQTAMEITQDQKEMCESPETH